MTAVTWDGLPGTVLVAGTPLDDDANRAHAHEFGLNWMTWPVPPPGSAQMSCGACGGGLMLDPDGSLLHHLARTSGRTAAVICLICLIVIHASYVTGLASADDSFEQLQALGRRLRENPAEAERIRHITADLDTAEPP